MNEKDYNNLLKEYLRGPEGRKVISRATKTNYLSPNFNKREYVAIAEELKNLIIDAYLRQVKTPGARYFDRDMVSIKFKETDTKKRKDGKVVFEIVFRGDALYRPSLFWDATDEHGKYHGGFTRAANSDGRYSRAGKERWGSGDYKQEGYYTGEGVYDIIGLFTNGYGDDTTPYVYGTWMHPETGNEWKHARSLPKRTGRKFIRDAIWQFKYRYPYIEIEYPKLWGGTLDPDGDWKRGPTKT